MTNTTRLLMIALFGGSMLSASPLVLAQSATADDPAFTLLESDRAVAFKAYPQGAWYADGESGSGWFMSDVYPGLDDQRFLAATQFTYRTNGAPLWLLAVAPSPEFKAYPTPADMIGGEPMATFRASLSEGHGGPCPTCPYVAPQVGASAYGEVEMRWVSPTFARVRINGQEVTPIQAGDTLVGPSLYDRLVGRHVGIERSKSRLNGVSEGWCEYVFTPTTNPAPGGVWRLGAGAATLPPSNARWLAIDASCGVATGPNPPLQRTSNFIAVPERGSQSHAVIVSLSTTGATPAATEIRNAAGALEGYTLNAAGGVGWVFASDSQTTSLLFALQMDRQRIRTETELKRAP